jgi:hypothetical protein
MQTLLIEVTNEKAFHLLQELEDLNILRIIKENIKENEIKLSDKYRGGVRKKMQKALIAITKECVKNGTILKACS